MKPRFQVQQTWQNQSRRERRILRSYAKASPNAGLRVRCKIVLALVRGSSPTDLVRSRMAASSLIYDVMHRFISQRLLGLVDRREDNGESKVTEEYETELFVVVPGLPREHGLSVRFSTLRDPVHYLALSDEQLWDFRNYARTGRPLAEKPTMMMSTTTNSPNCVAPWNGRFSVRAMGGRRIAR